MSYINDTDTQIETILKHNVINSSSEDILQKLAIFAIYDYKLSPDWGSQSGNIIQKFKENVGDAELNTLYIPSVKTSSDRVINYYLYRTYIKNLFNFFEDPLKKNCICEFGTKTHATVVYLNKINDQFINAVYINTGYGLNVGDNPMQIDGVDYWKIFKSIFIKNQAIDIVKFVQTIAPFIIYKICKNDNLTKTQYEGYLDNEYLRNRIFRTNYDGYYENMYLSKDDNNYFLKVQELFDGKSLFKRKITLDRPVQKMLANFVKKKEKIEAQLNKRIPEQIYIKKGLSSIIGKLYNDNDNGYMVFFLDQKGGTCTYRSALFAWLYHSFSNDVAIDSVLEKLGHLYIKLFKFIVPYVIKKLCNPKENINLKKFIEFMIEDGMMDKKFSYTNLDNEDFKKSFTITPNNLRSNKITIIPTPTDDELENIITRIRNGLISNTEIHEIYFKSKITPEMIEKIFLGEIWLSDTLSEETILLSLNEYYKNYATWETLLDDRYSLNDCIVSGRIDLLENEAIWIAKYLRYLVENTNRVDASSLSELWYFDVNGSKRRVETGYLLSYSKRITYDYIFETDAFNIIYDLKNVYQALVFEDPNTTTYERLKESTEYFGLYNPEKLNKMNLLSIKKMLLNYIKDNCFSIKINKNIDIFASNAFNTLMTFIIDNSKYLGVKITKYALLSVLKDYIRQNMKHNTIMMIYQVFFENYLFEKVKHEDHKFNAKKFGWCISSYEIRPGINLISDTRERTYVNIYGSELIKIVKNALESYSNYDEIIEYLKNYKFEFGGVINNKRMKIVDTNITIDDKECVPIKTNSKFINYLVCTDVQDNILLFERESNIVHIVFCKTNYFIDEGSHNTNAEDNIMSFNLIKRGEMYIIDPDKIEFNKNKIEYCNSDDTLKYPYLLYKRSVCKNFYIVKNNSHSILYIFNNWYDNYDFVVPHIDKNMFNVNKDEKSIILELSIKNNMITPLYTPNLKKIDEKLDSICYFTHQIANNKLNLQKFNEMKQRPISINQNKINLRIYGIINNTIECISEICNKIFINGKNVRRNINNIVAFDDVSYDVSSCTTCITHGPYIDIPVGTINADNEEKIYYEKEIDVNVHFQKFIRENPVCKLNVTDVLTMDVIMIFIAEMKDIIIRAKMELNEILISLITSINYTNVNRKEYSVIELIYDNYFNFNLILEINIYLQQLSRLEKIFSKEKLDLYELMEIDLLLKVTKFDYQNYLLGCIEIILAIIIKKEQWEKFRELINNYDGYVATGADKWQIHHFMMGKGKSSVITPLLAISISDKNINIIVPSHLIKQTEHTMYEFTKLFYLKLKIKDDATIKYEYLTNKLPVENNVYLIDEFDYMCNPLQSNYNIIIDTKMQYDKEVLDNLLEFVDAYYKKIPYTKPIEKYSYIDEANKVMNNKFFIQNLTFGMSKEDKNKRYCIPYARKDSPLEGSNFKSNIITLVLTIIYFYNNNFVLDIDDIYYIILKRNSYILNKLSLYYEIEITQFKMSNLDNLSSLIDNFDHTLDERLEKRYIIFLEYIALIMSSMRESTKIKNTSFYDIMNIDCLWQVGYSGTVNIIVPDYNSFIKYSNDIKKDYDEILGSYFALTGNYTNSRNEIFQINSYDDLLYKFRDPKYNVLIDACAFLKDIKNETIAENLSEILGKRVIYLTENDDKMMYFEGNHSPYTDMVYDSETVIFYYSQKHIVGVDFKQPNILNGIVLIKDDNNYTQIAQAIYRMRKLNRGHIAHIGYCGTKESILTLDKSAKENLYKQLVDNDLRNLQQTQNLSLLMTFKLFCRKFIKEDTQDKALEDFLTPLYKIPRCEEFIYNVIIKNIAINILGDNSLGELYIDFDSPDLIPLDNDYYKIYLNEIYRDNRHKFVSLGDDSVRIFDRMKALGLRDLLSVLYDMDDSAAPQVAAELDIQEQEEQETESERERQVQFIKSFVLRPDEIESLQKIIVRYYFNPYSRTLNNYYKWLEYDLNGCKVIFSTNLLMVLTDDVLSLCIVRLDNNTFLIENIYTVEFYYSLLPIYTMTGLLINQNFIPEDFRYDTIEMPLTNINTDRLFDTNIKINDAVFCMANLVGRPNSTNTINFSGSPLPTQKYIFTMLILINIFTQINSTATGITDENKRNYLDIRTCVDRFGYFNDEDYKKYIYSSLIKYYSSYTIKNDNLETGLSYKYKYIYFNYDNSIEKSFIFNPTIRITGGAKSHYFEKYIKYKNKYIALKKLM